MAERPRLENKKEIFGWAMFDFANSSFTTVMVTVVFAVYFRERVAEGRSGGDLLWALAIAVSQLIIILMAPLLGALADFSGAKKRFLFVSYVVCVLATAGLYFATPGAVLFAFVVFVIANAAFSASENFVSAFLPEIAPKEMLGRVSAYGWSLGYFGGLGCLVLCRLLLGGEDPPDERYRLTCLVTAAFFALAAVPTFLWVRERKAAETLAAGQTYLGVGFRRLRQTFREIKRYQELFKFLCAFFFMACGLWVVVAFAAIYARSTLLLPQSAIILFFLIVNVTAAVGAFLFGQLQDRIGSVWTIKITLIIWMVVVVGAFLCEAGNQVQFYVVGNLAGLALGATQSAGRALVGLFSPVEKDGEFFGFWALFFKLAAIGPTVFAVVSTGTETQRPAILVTGIFFLIGYLGMGFVNEKRGIEMARQPVGEA